MKRILSIIICLILITFSLSLSACSKTSDNENTGYDGEVNVYNWGEYISNGDDGSMDVIKEFEKQYNIKVNFTNFETNEELYNILKNSNPQYDVIIPSDYMIERLINEGMLEELDFSNIPNYANIMDIYKGKSYDSEEKYTVPYNAGTVAIVYNKTMVDKEDVKDFDVMWNEKYKGKILMFNNSKDAMAIAMQLCDPRIDPGDRNLSKDDIDRATDLLLKQKPLLKKYVMDQVFTEMETNQAAIAAYYAGDITTMMYNNENLDYCLPESGANWFCDAMCVPTCCQNKENAELFINFMASPEVAAANAEYIGYATPNQAAFEILDEEITSNELNYPGEEYLSKCYEYTDLPNDVYNYMQERFVKACSSSAEVSKMDESNPGSSLASKIAVLAIIILVVVLVIVVAIIDIVKAYKNRYLYKK